MVRRFFSAAVVVLAACTTMPPASESVSAEVEAQAQQAIAHLFPPQGLFVHKVRVDVGRRDLVMTGYLLLDREKGFQAVAVDEFGGKVFEFESCRGQTEIRVAPAALDHDLLQRGPLQDLKRLYLLPKTKLRVQQSRQGEVLVSWIDNDATIVCRAGSDGRRITGCDETRGTKREQLVRNISFSYDDVTTRTSLSPSSIKIMNRSLHYTMSAELLRVEDGVDQEVCP